MLVPALITGRVRLANCEQVRNHCSVARAQKLTEGAVFAVPLDPGFVLGVAARIDAPAAFGYFFAPLLRTVPEIEHAQHLDPGDAFFFCRFTAGALREGDWPTIGTFPDWQRDRWSLPLVCRYDELMEQYLLVRYGEDLFHPAAEFLLPQGQSSETYLTDELVGERALAKVLTQTLRGLG
jgi:hypothetical protein